MVKKKFNYQNEILINDYSLQSINHVFSLQFQPNDIFQHHNNKNIYLYDLRYNLKLGILIEIKKQNNKIVYLNSIQPNR